MTMLSLPTEDDGSAETYLAAKSFHVSLGKSEAQAVRLSVAQFPKSHDEWVRLCPKSDKPL
ncbi:hypothetical protein ACFL02_01790 [Planctomycetota bacterium]